MGLLQRRKVVYSCVAQIFGILFLNIDYAPLRWAGGRRAGAGRSRGRSGSRFVGRAIGVNFRLLELAPGRRGGQSGGLAVGHSVGTVVSQSVGCAGAGWSVGRWADGRAGVEQVWWLIWRSVMYSGGRGAVDRVRGQALGRFWGKVIDPHQSSSIFVESEPFS